MRPRTPSIIWIPFVFSIGGLSWMLLVASLAVLSALVLAPSIAEVKQAEAQRNNIQASVDLLDQKIALQQQFIEAAAKDPLVMQRLASRQLHLDRKDQEVLPIDPEALHRDRSVGTLIADSLQPVEPKPVSPLPWFIDAVLKKPMRTTLLMAACGALVLSFVLSVRFERH